MDDGRKEEHGGGTHLSPSHASAKLAAASRWGRHDEDRRQGHAPIHRPGGPLNHPGNPSTVPSSVFLTGANGDGGAQGMADLDTTPIHGVTTTVVFQEHAHHVGRSTAALAVSDAPARDGDGVQQACQQRRGRPPRPRRGQQEGRPGNPTRAVPKFDKEERHGQSRGDESPNGGRPHEEHVPAHRPPPPRGPGTHEAASRRQLIQLLRGTAGLTAESPTRAGQTDERNGGPHSRLRRDDEGAAHGRDLHHRLRGQDEHHHGQYCVKLNSSSPAPREAGCGGANAASTPSRKAPPRASRS